MKSLKPELDQELYLHLEQQLDRSLPSLAAWNLYNRIHRDLERDLEQHLYGQLYWKVRDALD